MFLTLSHSLSLSLCVCVCGLVAAEKTEKKRRKRQGSLYQPLFFPPFNFLCWQEEGELQPGVVRRLNLRMRRQKERWTLMRRKEKRKKKRTVEKMRNRPNLEVVIPSLYILTIFVLSFFSHQVVQFSVLVVVVKQSKVQTSTDAWHAIDRFSPITVLATTTLLKLGTVDGAWIAKSHAKKAQNDPPKKNNEGGGGNWRITLGGNVCCRPRRNCSWEQSVLYGMWKASVIETSIQKGDKCGITSVFVGCPSCLGGSMTFTPNTSTPSTVSGCCWIATFDML